MSAEGLTIAAAYNAILHVQTAAALAGYGGCQRQNIRSTVESEYKESSREVLGSIHEKIWLRHVVLVEKPRLQVVVGWDLDSPQSGPVWPLQDYESSRKLLESSINRMNQLASKVYALGVPDRNNHPPLHIVALGLGGLLALELAVRLSRYQPNMQVVLFDCPLLDEPLARAISDLNVCEVRTRKLVTGTVQLPAEFKYTAKVRHYLPEDDALPCIHRDQVIAYHVKPLQAACSNSCRPNGDCWDRVDFGGLQPEPLPPRENKPQPPPMGCKIVTIAEIREQVRQHNELFARHEREQEARKAQAQAAAAPPAADVQPGGSAPVVKALVPAIVAGVSSDKTVPPTRMNTPVSAAFNQESAAGIVAMSQVEPDATPEKRQVVWQNLKVAMLVVLIGSTAMGIDAMWHGRWGGWLDAVSQLVRAWLRF